MKIFNRQATGHLANDHGFTLVETVVAIGIFSIGILAVMTLTVNAMNGFSRSRTTCEEVNRTTLNLEALKESGYTNGNIFTGAQTNPVGTDGATVGYNDADNAVVFETKLISIRNTSVRGIGAAGDYELYYTKPFIE